jgi:hypothetical protein
LETDLKKLYCGNIALSLGGDIKAIAIALALKQIAAT